MTDLTKITTPFGLLEQEDPETAKALQECGGPWEIWHDRNIWLKCYDMPGMSHTVYRKKPAPREYVAWAVCDEKGDVVSLTIYSEEAARDHALTINGYVVKLMGTRDEG